MPEISFYHLTTTPLETALPKLLEKSLQAGLRSVVVLESEEMIETINHALWVYDPGSFLPHGSSKDGNADLQPVYLTDVQENPNNATLLMIANGISYNASKNFTRVLDIFDGKNQDHVAKARERWKHYKEAGFSLKYMKQGENGAWQQAQ